MKPTSETEQDVPATHPVSPVKSNRISGGDASTCVYNDETNTTTTANLKMSPVRRISPTPNHTVAVSEDGLVLPKKLANPCLDSKERLDLHRELMFNQKIGKNVLSQKTELQKVMEKRLDNQKKKEVEGERIQRRNSFERKLEEQATKLRAMEEEESGAKKPGSNNSRASSTTPEPELDEFLKIHAKLHAAHHANSDHQNANKLLVLDNAQ